MSCIIFVFVDNQLIFLNILAKTTKSLFCQNLIHFEQIMQKFPKIRYKIKKWENISYLHVIDSFGKFLKIYVQFSNLVKENGGFTFCDSSQTQPDDRQFLNF